MTESGEPCLHSSLDTSHVMCSMQMKPVSSTPCRLTRVAPRFSVDGTALDFPRSHLECKKSDVVSVAVKAAHWEGVVIHLRAFVLKAKHAKVAEKPSSGLI